MNIQTIPTGEMMENCYLIWDDNRIACVIDPGDNAGQILESVHKNHLDVQKILLTHGHFDHVGAVNQLKEACSATVIASSAEKALIEDNTMSLGFFIGERFEIPKVDSYVLPDEVITCGDLSFQVIHTPGHTAGSVCYLADGVLFSGDTVFQGTIGRCDFPTGNIKQITASVLNCIFTLPKDTVLYPGHGPKTTVGAEQEHNEVYQWLSI